MVFAYFFVVYEFITSDNQRVVHNDIIWTIHPLIWWAQEPPGGVSTVHEGSALLFYAEVPYAVAHHEDVIKMPYTALKQFQGL